jgi:hypothetical protein
LGEYQEIISSQRLETNEVYVPKIITGQESAPSFQQYLQDAVRQGWQSTARNQTQWDIGLMNLATYKKLIKILEEARMAAKELPVDQKRSAVMEAFRQGLKNSGTSPYDGGRLIQEVIGAAQDNSQIIDLINELEKAAGKKTAKKILRALEQESELDPFGTALTQRTHNPELAQSIAMQIRARKKELSLMGSDRIKIVQEFLTAKELPSDPEYLRTVIKAISYSPTLKQLDTDEARQYHLALVVNLQAISDTRSYRPEWNYVSSQQDHSTLLGTIAMIPDKRLSGELEQISRRAGKFSHPVFSSNGNVIYPKLTK